MNKVVKSWLIAGGILTILGSVIFTIALAAVGFDFSRLDTQNIVKNTHDITEDFNGISVDIDTADLVFATAEDGKCTVKCVEKEKLTHSVKVVNGTLVIRTVDSRRWYDNIGFSFGDTKITVYLPKDTYEALSVEMDTGDVTVPGALKFENIKIESDTGNVNCKALVSNNLSVSTDTGEIAVSGAACKSVNIESDTGNVLLKNVIASERLSVETETGDVKLDMCDAQDVYIETDTGDVRGTLLSPKKFLAKSATGDVNVPKTEDGGQCKIKTDTGNIKITVKG